MRFWDSSALFLVAAGQPGHVELRSLMATDKHVLVWWATRVEMASAASRLRRDGYLDEQTLPATLLSSDALCHQADEVEPSESVRQTALRVVRVHGLKAADSLQLAAALTWTGSNASGFEFVCLDKRLRAAAALEGFRVLPE